MTTYELLASLLLMAMLQWVFPLKAKAYCLLIVSLALYLQAGLIGFLIMFITVIINWFAAIRIEEIRKKEKRERSYDKEVKDSRKKTYIQRKTLCGITLFMDFGLLALIKYMPDYPAKLLTLIGHPAGFRLALTLGISFYTFQMTGYLIDVSGGKIAAERNPLHFALFLSYFPQLIQGPISRYTDLAPQLYSPSGLKLQNLRKGLIRVLWGLFKKAVVADRAALLVGAVFTSQNNYGGAVSVLGVLFYSLQQYADFSGGIDMVLGISETMGIRLPENFRQPYFATSLADFWRRWHITLGSWMRDYVFYPFALSKPIQKLSKALKKAGKRRLAGTLPAALGNILVFLLIGIWHGPSSNFIAWGFYNGIILAFSALIVPIFPQKPLTKARKMFCVARTFIIVNIGWFFDRSNSVTQAFDMIRKVIFTPMFSQLTDGTIKSLGLASGDYLVLAISTMILMTVSVLRERGMDVRERLLEIPIIPRWIMLYTFFLFVMICLTVGKNSGFMYAMY